MFNFQQRDESRGFIHKKILGAGVGLAAGLIPGGSAALGIARSIISGRGASKGAGQAIKFGGARTVDFRHTHSSGRPHTHFMGDPDPPCPSGKAWSRQDLQCVTHARIAQIASGADVRMLTSPSAAIFGLPTGDPNCPIPGQRIDPVTGRCAWFLGDRSGPDDVPLPSGNGGARGPLGVAGSIPSDRPVMRRVCPRGMVLGKDERCYDRRSIKNRDRKWPKSTRPLGSPEEMRAVRIASRFGGRLELTNKRMQKIGLLKKPAVRRRAPSAADVHHAS